MILNEAAVRKIGWQTGESALGKKILSPDGEVTFEVVGVVKDFHYWSLENRIEPMAIFHLESKKITGTGPGKFVTLRVVENSQATEILEKIKSLWKVHAGDAPFQYSFVHQDFEATFKTQNRFGSVLSAMTGLAFFIASLGLLGMIIYSLEQRTKEIGIRKISGASVTDVLVLLSKGHVILIVIAFVISAPLSYYLMQIWLEDFAYRITPSWATYLLVGVLTLIIALAMTMYHTAKAATSNPVDILKDE